MCTHGRIKKYTRMWCMDAKLLLTPPGTQTKFTDTRVTAALKSEKHLALILMRKYILLSTFWILSTKKHWRNTHSRNERNKRSLYSDSNGKYVISLNLKKFQTLLIHPRGTRDRIGVRISFVRVLAEENYKYNIENPYRQHLQSFPDNQPCQWSI